MNSRKRKSSTQGSPPPSKRTTYNVKPSSSPPDTRTTNSSPTSDPASTGNERACFPFWTPLTAEISKKLWWPPGTDCAGSPSTSWSTSSDRTASDSWSSSPSTNRPSGSSPTTSCPSSRSSVAGGTDNASTAAPENKSVFRTRKIKLNPTREQKLALNKFAQAARYTYNECVASVNRGDAANKMRLRNQYVTAKDNEFFRDKEWLLETPKVIRQQAAFEAAKNFKAAWTNLRNKNITKFEIDFKSKRDRKYVVGIEKAVTFAKNVLTILPETIGAVRYFEKPPFQGKPDAECSVMRDAHGDFWLMVPTKRVVKKTPNMGVLAIDPGVRNPFACYSPEGRAFMEGDDMKERIEEIHRRVSAVDKRLRSSKGEDRRKLLLHRLRLFRRYQRVRDDCHWKLIHRMTEEYGTILLPHLQTSRLCGGLRAKSNRQMFGVSHFVFKQRMASKCEEKTVRFVEADEAYTSKTCGACGRLHDSLGSSKVFLCPGCGLRCDRDLHAARNIYLRWACEEGLKSKRPDETLWGSRAPMAS